MDLVMACHTLPFKETMLSKYRLLHSSRSLTCSCFRDL